MEKLTVLAVDTGNYSIKTPNCSFRASLVVDHGDLRGERLVLPDGTGYSIGKIDTNHQDTKATEEYKRLVMVGMAKELMFLSKKSEEKMPKKYVRDNILLALGLPPEHMSRYRDIYTEYFVGRYKFEYAEINFELTVNEVMVFPQCLAAASGYLDDYMDEADDIFLIDIGGYTTDVIRIFEGRPDRSIVISSPYGVQHYYNELQHRILTEKNWRMGPDSFDSYFLKGSNNDRKKKNKLASLYDESNKEYVFKMLAGLYTQGVRMESALPVFLGGGSKIFKEAIKEYFHERIPNAMYDPEFITDVKANAIGYRDMALERLEKREKTNR